MSAFIPPSINAPKCTSAISGLLRTGISIRKFTAETGETVARVVERIRVDTAKGMLENGVGNVEKVARLCGFGSTGRMRRAFLKYWDKSSQAFK
ncbi:helix-turn-helix domain-containing protein [Pantoea allii]|uniref:helix-turn-helix domain-containing protein n=1 Tax=Pantoea allii TaxID=574096 RepID=UPI003977B0CE